MSRLVAPRPHAKETQRLLERPRRRCHITSGICKGLTITLASEAGSITSNKTLFPPALAQTRSELRGIQGRYEMRALLRSEEDAIVVGGLLVGLNTIDCNLCLKPDKEKNTGANEGLRIN